MKHQIREIDDVKYQVSPFGGYNCFLHHAAMLKILGEPLTRFVIGAVSKSTENKTGTLSHLKKSGLDQNIEEYLPAVAQALGAFATSLDPQGMLDLFQGLLTETMVIKSNDSGKEIPTKLNFNLQFHGGKMVHLYRVIMFVLEVNYSDFFPAGIDLVTVAKDLVADDQ